MEGDAWPRDLGHIYQYEIYANELRYA